LADLKPQAVRRVPRRHNILNYRVPVSKILGDRNRFFAEELKGRPVRRNPGLDALLDGVAAAGLAIGLVTTTPSDWLGQVLEDIGLPSETFDTIITADQVVAAKPQPDCYHLAAAMIAVAPEDCLAVEDSIFGAQAAESAGMSVRMMPSLRAPEESMAHLLRTAVQNDQEQG